MSASNLNQLSFHCPHCAKRLRAPEKLVGKQLNCPKCNNPLTVPTLEEISKLESQRSYHSSDSDASKTAAQNQESPSGSSEAQAGIASKDTSTAPLSAPVSRGSLFDDDLPELAPLVESALQKQRVSNGTQADRTKLQQPSASNPGNRPSAAKPKGEPSGEPSPDLNEDDEFRLAPIESPPSRSKPRPFDFDDLPPGLNLDSNPSGEPQSIDSVLDKIKLSGGALDVGVSKAREQEFWFPCKVCGTRIVATPSQIGTSVQCSDCYSNLSVPPPPVAKSKPKPVSMRREDLADVSFEPVKANTGKYVIDSKSQTEELLRKAKKDADAEQEEIEALTVDFDTQKWLSKLFWFLKDPQLIFITVLMGFFSAIWLGFANSAPELFQLPNDRVKAVVQGILYILPGMFIGVAIISLAMCVVNMVANQYKQVQDWPTGRPGDVFGEVIFVGAAAAIASAPGGVLAMLLTASTDSKLVFPLFTLVSFWAFFPFVFLSISENSSITEPFSKSVLESVSSKKDQWGAMYLQTMLVFSTLFILIAWAMRASQVGHILLGLFGPFLILFLFNQYGLLAGRISDVTGLDYRGDFSDENSDDNSNDI